MDVLPRFSHNFQAEFSGGALRCGEFVTLRKVGDPTQKVRPGPISLDTTRITNG